MSISESDAILDDALEGLRRGDFSRLDYLFLFSEDADEAEIERQIAASLVTTKEDIEICEAVQRNLDAGIYQTGRLSPKHEMGVAWFQKQVLRAIG